MYKINKYLSDPSNINMMNYNNANYVEKLIINEIIEQSGNGGSFLIPKTENFNWNEINSFDNFLLHIKDIKNINYIQNCKLLNTEKRKEFYIYNYDVPTELIVFDTFNIIDKTERKNCCNCFVFSIYAITSNSNNTELFELLLNYVQSIVMSVNNIVQVLKTWIIKVYIDINVINSINYIKVNDYKELQDVVDLLVQNLEYLFAHPNVEMYINKCDNEDDKYKGYKRSYRSLPLNEIDTNIVSMRDADSIVTMTECYNILYFSKLKDKYFYITAFNYSPYSTHKRPFSYKGTGTYSSWLNDYVSLNSDFYEDNSDIFDLLAGLVTFKLKINSHIYSEKVLEAHKYTTNSVTFDEIFLKHLFKGLISYSKNNKDEYDAKSKFFLYIYDDDVLNINIDIDKEPLQPFEIIEPLEPLKQLKLLELLKDLYNLILSSVEESLAPLFLLIIYDALIKYNKNAGEKLINIQLLTKNNKIFSAIGDVISKKCSLEVLNICTFNNKSMHYSFNEYFTYIWTLLN